MDVTWWAMPNIVEIGCPRGGFIDIERFAVRVDRCVVDNDTELRITNNTDLQALSVTLAYYRPRWAYTDGSGRPTARPPPCHPHARRLQDEKGERTVRPISSIRTVTKLVAALPGSSPN